MKIINYAACLLLLSSMVSCQDDTAGLGVLPEVSEDMYSVYIDEEDPNLVHFDLTADRLQPLWEIELKGGTKVTSNDRNFTLTMSKGDYKGCLMVYGRSGKSPKHEFSFHVEAPDPAVRMLCGTDEANPKVWVWDIWGEYNNSGQQRIFGYLWGDDWRSASYYNPLEDMKGGAMQGSMLDDKMSFRQDGTFVLEANNTVWVDGDITGVGGWGVERAGIAEWQPKGTEAWALIDNGDKRYIRFSGGGFPSVVADPTGVDADYEIVEISQEHLRLRWWRGEGDGIEFNFVPEDYQGEDPTPPTPPEPVVLPEQEKVTPLAKDAAEYAKLTGYSWKVGSLLAYINADGSQTGFETPDFLIGDILNFNTDGSVTFNLGDDNRVFDNENGIWNYTAKGTEGFVLGTLANGNLAVQFTGEAFPIISPVAKYQDLTFEVLKLTDTDLQLAWAYKDYNADLKYFVINYSATPKDDTPTPPVQDDFAEQKAMLTAHPWKIVDGGPALEDMWGPVGGSKEEVMTLNADGSMTITGDGTAESCNDGAFDYTSYTNMTWSYSENDGKKYLAFGNNGFPCAVGTLDNLGKTWEVVELSADSMTLKIECGLDWLPNYYLILNPAE